MAKKRVTKALHYRYASFLHGKETLQTLVTRALNKLSVVRERMEYLTDTETESRVVNNHPQYGGMQFGNLIYFERGSNKLLLSTDTSVDELDVQQISPPPMNGKRSEFLDSILYFGILGNHVILLQSMALGSADLEEHLNWLLREATVIPDTQRVELIAAAKPDIRDAIAKKPIKSVKFGSPFLELDQALSNARPPSKVMTRLGVDGIGPAIMRAILGDEGFAKLKLDEVTQQDSNLKVVLEISYDRTTDADGQKALHSIARALRHIDSEEVALKIPGLGTVKGSDLKISDTVRLDSYSGLLNPNEVFPAMLEWITSLLRQGVVADHG